MSNLKSMLTALMTITTMIAVTTMATMSILLPVPCADAADVQSLSETEHAIQRDGATRKTTEGTEIQQVPGFPIVLQPDPLQEGSNEPAAQWSLGGAVLADLDGTGGLEIVHSVQTGGTNFWAGAPGVSGRLFAWDSAGNVLPGFPVELVGGAYHAPSVSDLDGDGDLEIVQLTDLKAGEEPLTTTRLYVVDHEGNVLPGFPVIAGEALLLQGASLYDLDDDGVQEIVFGSMSGLSVFRIDGSEWPVQWEVPGLGVGIPAIGDMDMDGEPEIFVTTETTVHLLETDGTELAGWPPQLPPHTWFPWMSLAALADLDNDVDLEVVVAAVEGLDTGPTVVYAFHHDGTIVQGWPVTIDFEVDFISDFICSPLVTDLEGDGELEVLIGSGSVTGQSEIYAWSSSGELKPGFPYRSEQGQAGGYSHVFMLTAADANGDGREEVFADSGIGAEFGNPSYQGYIFGIDASGNDLPGFPMRPMGFNGQNGLVIDDVDNDGDYEAVSISRELDSKVMYVNMYDLPWEYLRSDTDWPTFHAANQRGGLLKRQYRGWRYIYAGGRTGR